MSVYVCVCAYVYVCINVTNQNNVIFATYKTQYRVLLFEFQRKFKTFVPYTRPKVYLIEMLLHFLVD